MPQPERKHALVTRFTTASFHLDYFFFAVLCLSSSSLIRLARWRLIVESKCRYVTAALAVSSSLPSWFFSSPCPLAGFLISNNHILTRESFSLSFLRSRHSRIPSPSPSPIQFPSRPHHCDDYKHIHTVCSWEPHKLPDYERLKYFTTVYEQLNTYTFLSFACLSRSAH